MLIFQLFLVVYVEEFLDVQRDHKETLIHFICFYEINSPCGTVSGHTETYLEDNEHLIHFYPFYETNRLKLEQSLDVLKHAGNERLIDLINLLKQTVFM